MASLTIKCPLCVRIFLIAMASLPAYARTPYYVFTLPPDYVGWVQIVFQDPGSQPFAFKKDALEVSIGESGIARTSNFRVSFVPVRDEFYYRTTDTPRLERLVPVPADYVLGGPNHGGFEVGLVPDGSPGSLSWFFFVGPPDMREKIPMADITREKGYGKPLKAPVVYPVPGRMHR
jgi:hypothetical protein